MFDRKVSSAKSVLQTLPVGQVSSLDEAWSFRKLWEYQLLAAEATSESFLRFCTTSSYLKQMLSIFAE